MRVAQVCRRELQFEKDIHLRSLDQWDALITANPFKHVKEPRFLHAPVLDSVPDAANVERLHAVASGGDAFAVIGRTAYLHTPQGFGTSKLAERFDRWIGVSNTARNWNSVLKLRELAARASEGA